MSFTAISPVSSTFRSKKKIINTTPPDLEASNAYLEQGRASWLFPWSGDVRKLKFWHMNFTPG